MATTFAHERFSPLERFRQLNAVNLLMAHLTIAPGDGMTPAPLEDLFEEDILDLMGLDEWIELYGSDPDDPDSEEKEPSTMELLRGELLLAQLFSRLANASAYCAERADFFHKLAMKRVEELEADDA